MEYDSAKEILTFASGTKVSVNCGIVGIDHHGQLYEGYDGPIYHYPDDEYSTELSRLSGPEDCIELADYMIERWKKFKKQFEEGT